MQKRRTQSGSFMIEALVSIFIFSLGILAMMSASRAAMTANGDALARAEAARYANDIMQQIWLNVDRSSKPDEAAFQTSLSNFAYQPEGTNCAFTGSTASTSNAFIQQWLDSVKNTSSGLPGAADNYQQIKVDLAPTNGQNLVTVTVCWKNPSDSVARQLSLMSNVG